MSGPIVVGVITWIRQIFEGIREKAPGVGGVIRAANDPGHGVVDIVKGIRVLSRKDLKLVAGGAYIKRYDRLTHLEARRPRGCRGRTGSPRRGGPLAKVVQVRPIDEGQDVEGPTAGLTGAKATIRIAGPPPGPAAAGQVMVFRFQGQAGLCHLRQVVGALDPTAGLLRRLHRRHEQGHQHADNGHHDQQFHQGKTVATAGLAGFDIAENRRHGYASSRKGLCKTERRSRPSTGRRTIRNLFQKQVQAACFPGSSKVFGRSSQY